MSYMNKYLLIALATGGGHHSVAKALELRLKEAGHETLTIDLFKEIESKNLDRLVCGGYNLIATKAPRLYEPIYRGGNRDVLARGYFGLTRRVCRHKVQEYVDAYGPTTIIAVHPIVTDILGGMKLEGKLENIEIVSVITDYLAHHAYARKHKGVDKYLVATTTTKEDLINRGVLPEKVYPYGIPVRREFYNEYQKKEKKMFTVLVMGGSLGSKGIFKVIQQLTDFQEKIKILIVCGKDIKLKNKLDFYLKEKDNKNIEVYGFTDNVDQLMEEADVLISKPGGASLTEAILKRIPMLIPYTLGGQEKENLEYAVREGIALKIKDINQINEIVQDFYEHREKLQAMEEKMDSLAKGFSIDKTIEVLIDK